MKTCKFCNKEFKPHSNRQIYCDGPHVRICPICNNEYIETNNNQLQFPPHACSYKCRGILQSQTKSNKPKKLTKLQQIFEDNPQFSDNFKNFNILNRGKIIPKLEQLLKDNNISYMCPIHIENQQYAFWIKDQNMLVALSEISVDRDHNLAKIQIAENNGYNCFIIYPWDNLEKIVWQLKPKIEVDLDRCSMFKLNKQPSIEFLDKYHLKNACRNQLLFWGIVKDNEIIQIMTFGKPRYNKQYSVELMRSCTKPGIQIPGGYMNLFYGVESLQYLQNIIGYQQIGRFKDMNFETLQFEYLKTTPPQEVWSKENKHITASLLRARGYDQLFGTHYGKGVSNEMLMLQNGWLPIYDCGQKVFVYV